jgi:hypothetical protein
VRNVTRSGLQLADEASDIVSQVDAEGQPFTQEDVRWRSDVFVGLVFALDVWVPGRNRSAPR